MGRRGQEQGNEQLARLQSLLHTEDGSAQTQQVQSASQPAQVPVQDVQQAEETQEEFSEDEEYEDEDEEYVEELTVGQWVGTLLLLMIVPINLILLLVWAFGKNTHPTKKNYSRAVLILSLISTIIVFVITITTGVGAALLVNQY